MARETRRQRRDARRAAGQQQASGGAIAARAPRLGAGPAPVAEEAAPALAHRVGPRRFSFVRESWGELKKVEWPGRAQVVQGTIVVLIACAIVGIFLYGADQAIRPFVKHVLLGQ
ncbi:MAG TPA: preprotein translocase subunit SecE [Gaiellaceae bacterium]|nr:preprotein translocase subunit SecE [Gaiellaceae bacterium]